MRISGTGTASVAAAGPTANVAPAAAAEPAPVGPLQSAVLEPALEALRKMPEIDLERVAALRDALAKGEVPFDAAKLAGLIERFHGRKG
jgi:negative regulator of flagellin synthesis FlgM